MCRYGCGRFLGLLWFELAWIGVSPKEEKTFLSKMRLACSLGLLFLGVMV